MYCRGGSDYGLIDSTAVSGKNHVAGNGDTFAYCAKMALGKENTFGCCLFLSAKQTYIS